MTFNKNQFNPDLYIEDFVSERLTGQKLKQFQTLLATDKNLQAQVKAQEAIENWASQERTISNRHLINKVRTKHTAKGVVQKLRRRNIRRVSVGIAATLILLLTVGNFFSPNSTILNGQALYEEYKDYKTAEYHQEDFIGVSTPAKEAALIKKGWELTQKGKYQEAVTVLDELEEMNPLYLQTYIVRGRAYLNLGATENAIEDLKVAYNNGYYDEQLSAEASWWLMIAYLKSEDKSRVRAIIERNTTDTYQKTLPNAIKKWAMEDN